MENTIEIKSYSDLTPEEKSNVIATAFKRAAKWVAPFGEQLVRNGFEKKGSIAFCAFIGKKNLGFFRMQIKGTELVEGPIYAPASKAAVIQTGKTVGVLLHEKALEYCKNHALTYTKRVPQTATEIKLVHRLRIGKLGPKRLVSKRIKH